MGIWAGAEKVHRTRYLCSLESTVQILAIIRASEEERRNHQRSISQWVEKDGGV